MANRTVMPSMLLGVLATFASGAHADQFDAYHPDQQFRSKAIKNWEANDPAQSLQDFMRAARFADKTSQLSVALMYWNGDAVTVDRATAYAWADLAAERGYPSFLRTRETMWDAMNEEERARAIQIGTELYREYGDAAAKPRLENLLRLGLRQKTGTRTGSHMKDPKVIAITPQARAALQSATGASPYLAFTSALRFAKVASSLDGYWNDENWRPKEYWNHQDSFWLPNGQVTVGPLASEEKAPRERAGESH